MATILVVEDTLTEAEIITGTLRKAGFTAMAAGSSEEARTKIGQQKPDAIVLDVVLPGISGFEFCRELKDDPATASIPVVLCTTKNTEMDRFWGLKQGAASFVAKPIDEAELLKAVKSVM